MPLLPVIWNRLLACPRGTCLFSCMKTITRIGPSATVSVPWRWSSRSAPTADRILVPAGIGFRGIRAGMFSQCGYTAADRAGGAMSGQVIVVDDEAVIREAVQQWLELSGFSVRTCASAEQALALVDRDFPGVLVSDVRLPGCDGLQLLEQLQGIDRDLPVIMVTGHG